MRTSRARLVKQTLRCNAKSNVSGALLSIVSQRTDVVTSEGRRCRLAWWACRKRRSEWHLFGHSKRPLSLIAIIPSLHKPQPHKSNHFESNESNGTASLISYSPSWAAKQSMDRAAVMSVGRKSPEEGEGSWEGGRE